MSMLNARGFCKNSPFFIGFPLGFAGQFLADGAPLDATGISSLELHAAINNRPTTRVSLLVEWVDAAQGLFSATIMDTSAMVAGTYEVQAAYIEDGLRKPSTIGAFELKRGV